MSLWFSEYHSKHVRFSIAVEKQIFCRDSEYQKIEVFTSKEFGRVLVMDGCIMLTEKDEFIYHEMMVHVPMAVLGKKARSVLIIGGGDGGTVREMARYPEVETIDMVEIDPLVVKVAKKHLPKVATAFDDPRLTVLYEDGLKYVRGQNDRYDLIIVDSTDPFGPGESLFTREFYGNCYKALKADGILVNQHESPYYKQDARMVRETHRRTKAVFPVNRLYQAHIPTYPSGHWLFGFMTKGMDPLRDLDEEGWNARRLKTRYYNTELHKGAFALPNYVKKLLEE